jgi:hypothetical protein
MDAKRASEIKKLVSLTDIMVLVELREHTTPYGGATVDVMIGRLNALEVYPMPFTGKMVRERFSRLRRRGYVANGPRYMSYGTYFITDQGLEILREVGAIDGEGDGEPDGGEED